MLVLLLAGALLMVVLVHDRVLLYVAIAVYFVLCVFCFRFLLVLLLPSAHPSPRFSSAAVGQDRKIKNKNFKHSHDLRDAKVGICVGHSLHMQLVPVNSPRTSIGALHHLFSHGFSPQLNTPTYSHASYTPCFFLNTTNRLCSTRRFST